jgi:hypothetical protein
MIGKKGMGVVFLIGVFAFVFILINILMFFLITVFANDTQNLFFLSMSSNDRGKELKCFLLSEKGGNFIDKLGNTVIDKGRTDLEASKQIMLDTLKEMDKSCMTVYRGVTPENPIITVGTCPSEDDEQDIQDQQIAEIPTPGARTGQNRIMVMIQ